MRRKIVRKGLLLLVIISLLLPGCAQRGDLRTNSYRTLASGAAIYESGYPAFLELYDRGLITAEQRAAGKNLAVKYWAAYHGAVEALIALDALQTADSKTQVTVALAAVSRCLAELTEYIQPFIVKTE